MKASLIFGCVVLLGACTGAAENSAPTTVARETTITESSTTGTTPVAEMLPAPRMGHAMVSIGDGKLLVFGGQTLRGNSIAYLRDTWIYDAVGQSWAMVAEDGPAPRSQHAMAFDPVRNQVLVFGGYVGSSFTYGDTWLFDVENESWRRVEVDAGPSARAGSVAVFDDSADRFVMFAGAEEPPAAELPLAETWIFDPTTGLWTEQFTNQAPSLLSEGHPTLFELAMVYDSASRRSVLLVAGESTWVYDATTVAWAKVDAGLSQGLGADYMTAAAFDSSAGRTIAYGGAPTGRTSATWAYDSTADVWRTIGTASAVPGPIANHAMAFDATTSRVFLFGGAASVLTLDASNPITNALWAFDGGSWSPAG